MTIRLACIDDIPKLNKLVNSAYRGEGSKKGWTTEADILDGIRTSENSLTKMLTSPNSVILLAEEGTELQGCVYLEEQTDGKEYLGMLTVQPHLQGRGIGAQLMRAAEERAKNLGFKKIGMTVITVRHTLIAYYIKRGYYDTCERKPFPNDPEFGIPKQPLEFMVMEKVIA